MRSNPPARRHPWWIPPFLGRVHAEVEPRLVSLLGFVSFALFFENYDFSLLASALKHIAEDLQIPETRLGTFSALIRLGALPAFVIIPLTDYLGRRRVFLAAVLGLGLGTFATGFSQTEAQFVACQMVARTAMLVASAVAFVIVTEEYPASERGWGIGMLAAIASIGHGLGAALFALVDVLPFGWRALYAVGVTPVLLLPLFRRGIGETGRFRHHQSVRGARASHVSEWLKPLGSLLRRYPLRALGILGIGATSTVGQATVFAFIGYFVMKEHGWFPWQYSVMVIVCGALGVFGNIVGGRLADAYGRRIVGFAMFASFPVFAWLFFRGPGWSLPFIWILLVFTVMAAGVISRALATELFPTDQRGTATGLMALSETLGAASGLKALDLLSEQQGDLVAILPWVASVTLVAAVLILLFPETSRRELEVIAEVETPSRARAAGTTRHDEGEIECAPPGQG